MSLFQHTSVAGASLLGFALITSASIASYTAYEIKVSQDTIEVTGSAKVAVVADHARFTLNLEAKTGINNQTDGYVRLENATKKIAAALEEQGYENIETLAPSVSPNYTYPQYGEPMMTGYTVNRQIVVQSDIIENIQTLAGNIEPFTGTGYTVSTGPVELTYQKLPETRILLLSDAITDATARAEAIAKESNRDVGALRSASSGVVQVLAAGSTDISDYGMYDTGSVHKEVMVTVRAKFSLK
jgi:hypothetical protein